MNEKARKMWQKIEPGKFREDMTPIEEIRFIQNMYDCYEAENDFSPVYCSAHGAEDKYNGQPYQLVQRVEIPKVFFALNERTDQFNSEIVNFPMWNIKFANGETVAAFDSEIIVRSIMESGSRVSPGTKPLTLDQIKMPIGERDYSFYVIELGCDGTDISPEFICIKADHFPTEAEAESFLKDDMRELGYTLIANILPVSDKTAASYGMTRGNNKPVLREQEKEYIVRRYYQSTVTVKASSPDEALDKAGDMEGSIQLLDEDEVEEILR